MSEPLGSITDVQSFRRRPSAGRTVREVSKVGEVHQSFTGTARWGETAARASKSRPFLRWAGGKARFIQLYGHLIPDFNGKYLEPFFGGGAMFFHLSRTQRRPFQTCIGDTNVHVIRTLQELRSRPEQLIDRLGAIQSSYSASLDKTVFYYELREAFNKNMPRTNAAQFIFLNRTCWNGLWRVNQLGKFNVPFGAPKSDHVVPTADDLINASAALQAATMRTTSWQNIIAAAEAGDFVFLDPPYYSDLAPGNASARESGKRKYSVREFTEAEHRELARTAANLRERGVHFMLTNSAEAQMVDLYREFRLNVRLTSIPRWINSDAGARHSITELLVTP